MKTIHVVMLVFVCVVYLSLLRLGNTYFWDDEAHVGIIARNFLATGHFTAWDGKNLYALRNGTNLDKNLRIINPPLEYLVTAGSFRIFGVSTWTGRLPFVVAGLLGLAVFTLLLQHEFKRDAWLWLYTLGGFALSPVFLLNIRQCRYYALSLLFSLLTFYIYRACLRTRCMPYFILLAGASILSFYSNPLLCVAFLLALGVVHVAFHRGDFGRNDYGKLTIAIVLFVFSTIPYAVHQQIWDRPDIPAVEIWYIRKLKLLWWNFRELNLLGCLPWVVAGGLFYFLLRYRHQHRAVVRTTWEWLTLSLGYVGFLALFSPQPTWFSTIADIRYLIPAVPFLLGLVGIFLWFMHQRMPLLALTLFVVSLISNGLTLTPFHREFRWLLPAYLKEIHQDYPTAYRAVVHFLQDNARQDDLIFTYPQHTNYPIMFYAGDTLRFCCLLNNQTQLPQQSIEALHAPLFIEQNAPDWFVAFSFDLATVRLLASFSQPRQGGGESSVCHYNLVKLLDVYWDDTQRPELPWHSFGPKTDFDRRHEAVYIFKRTGDAASAEGVIPSDVL